MHKCWKRVEFDRRWSFVARDLEVQTNNDGSSVMSANGNGQVQENQEGRPSMDLHESQGQTLSPRVQKASEGADLQRSQTIGQRFMDNIFMRSFTSKPKNPASDVVIQPSPSQSVDVVGEESEDLTESPFMGTVRGKCITQLLLLGALDSIQKKYWTKLKAYQKITILEILFSMLEFAASYNSYTNLRLRMQHIPSERPPLNLLRQELAGTCIYLDALQKSTCGVEKSEDDDVAVKSDAEEKLVSFCGQVLKEASEFQSSIGEGANMEVHQVLGLRSPIIVKVLKGMCVMDNQIFRKHLRSFYPLITKLVCCEQMDIRGALAELFSMQLNGLVQ